MGKNYQNGSFLTECMVSGRIARRETVQHGSWKN